MRRSDKPTSKKPIYYHHLKMDQLKFNHPASESHYLLKYNLKVVISISSSIRMKYNNNMIK